MSESKENKNVHKDDFKSKTVDEANDQKAELTIEEKLKRSEEKLLRALADSENQRRRFEKEIKDAFEFGGFNFARFRVIRARFHCRGDQLVKDSG